jgi:hypothetical protein
VCIHLPLIICRKSRNLSLIIEGYFVSEESFKSTTNNVQALNEALDAFRLKLCKPGQFQVSQPMPSGQKVHWSDVMKELQNAQNYYKTRHGGGPIGKAISKFGRYTESLKGWLDLLPAGDYGSTICGTYASIIFDTIYAKRGLYRRTQAIVIGMTAGTFQIELILNPQAPTDAM